MKTFDKHKKNLRKVGDNIYSYDTHVATVIYDKHSNPAYISQHGWWSVTTQRHINYVGREFELPVIKTYEQV